MGENGCSVLFPYGQSLPDNAQREHGQTLLRCGEMCKSQKHKRVRKRAASLPAPSHQMLSTKSRSLAHTSGFSYLYPSRGSQGWSCLLGLGSVRTAYVETDGQSVEALGNKIPDHPVKRHR